MKLPPMAHLDWPFFAESHRVLAAAWLRDEGATVTSEAAMAEGATEVQQLIIARELLKDVKGNRS